MLVFITNSSMHRIRQSLGLGYNECGDAPEVLIDLSGDLFVKCEGDSVPVSDLAPLWRHEVVAAVCEAMGRRARRSVDVVCENPMREIRPWILALARLDEKI